MRSFRTSLIWCACILIVNLGPIPIVSAFAMMSNANASSIRSIARASQPAGEPSLEVGVGVPLDPAWQPILDLQVNVYEELIGLPFDAQTSQFFLADPVQGNGVYEGFDGVDSQFTFTVVQSFYIDLDDPNLNANPEDIVYLQSIGMEQYWCIALMEADEIVVPVIAAVYSHFAEGVNRTTEIIIFNRMNDDVVVALTDLASIQAEGFEDPNAEPNFATCIACLNGCKNTLQQDMAVCAGISEICTATIVGCVLAIAVCAATCLLNVAVCTACLRWVGRGCAGALLACVAATASCVLGAGNKYNVCKAQCLALPACQGYAEE